ncbi:MAG: hypothetical protein ACREAQ_06465 [Nitrososphaera sp.]
MLDAAEALAEHRDAIILVGAQAIYLHTGDANMTVPEYTTDADFTVSPGELAERPLIGDLLAARGFTLGEQPGRWVSPEGIAVDFMVPEALAGPGTRGARLGLHGKRAARRAKGLEAALVDRDHRAIDALDPNDPRSITLWVAGPGALLVAKTHKIAERVGAPDRLRDKDALDVLRLLRAVDTSLLVDRLTALADDELSAPVTVEARAQLERLFSTAASEGATMAARAAGPGEDPATIATSLAALVNDLLEGL